MKPPNPSPEPSPQLAVNRELWNAWTEINQTSKFYDLDAFRAGRSSLNPIELEELGDVEGKSLLHLQCHFGLDTLSWARLGARATGIDLSDNSIELARSLAEELSIPARFVRSDVYDVPEVLGDETFDIVFTSYGVLDWLSDLDRWARVVASRLRPGGVFHIVEFHPAALVLDEEKNLAYPYFPSSEPMRLVEQGSYADPDADFSHDSYQWCHSLGEIVTAVASAGLRIEHLHEFSESPYDCFPFTTEVEPGRAVIAGLEDKVPLMFSLKAIREA